ncbi:hypothetical protein [Nibricoccus sp. IMCC34717]|uniref:hypothetical protein n=1 Tax=Nibricoccus sp. IMCC34717 TaxID=3034021 RepID=UPI00385036BC
MSDLATQPEQPRGPGSAWDHAGRVGHGLASTTAWLLFAAVLALVWYASPRGFDLLDSGCYYLEYAFPHDSADTHTSYRFFAAPLFAAVGGNIVAFRWLSWVLLWGSAGVLAWGTTRALGLARAHNTRVAPPAFALVLVGLLHASSPMYAIKPAALTYNSLNLIAVNCALGLFLFGLAGLLQPNPSRRVFVAIGAALTVAGVEFFIKPTTSAFLLVSLCALCLLTPGVPAVLKKRLALAAVVAGVVGLLAMLVFLGGPSAVMTRFGTLLQILENRTYMEVLLTRTAREFGELRAFLVSDLVRPALALGVGAVLTAFLPARARPWLAGVATIAVFGFWIQRVIEAGLWRGSHQLYMHGLVARAHLTLLLLALGLLAASWLVLRRWRAPACPRTPGWWFLVVPLLGVTPFFGAFGSTTTVYLNGALYTSCSFAALLLVLQRLQLHWQTRALIPVATVAVAGLSLAQLYHGQVMMPYMQNSPLWTQQTPVRFGEAGSVLLVDETSAGYIEKTRSVLEQHGFKKGDDLFCFFNMPGLVFAVGGRSPVIPWYFGRIYVDDPVEEFYMRRAGPDRVRRAWVLTQDDVTRFREHFHRGGIAFPEGYDRLAKFTSPFTALEIGIWKPRDSVAKP